MKHSIRARAPALFGAFAAAMLALPGAAFGQIFYSGYTTGCFGAGCTPTTNADGWVDLNAPDARLRYVFSTFSGTAPTNQLFTIGNPANGANVSPETDNFGAFYLAMTGTGTTNYNTLFTLAVHLVDPGSGLAVFTATLTGTVAIKSGQVTIAFTNSPQSFKYYDPQGTHLGTFTTLGLTDPVVVIPGNLGQITHRMIAGEAYISPTPEPASMILIGSGLLGLAGAARRRRRREDPLVAEA